MSQRTRIVVLALIFLVAAAGAFAARERATPACPPLRNRAPGAGLGSGITTKLGYHAALVKGGLSNPEGIGVSTTGGTIYFVEGGSDLYRLFSGQVQSFPTAYTLKTCRLRGGLYVGDYYGSVLRIGANGSVTPWSHDYDNYIVSGLDADPQTGKVYFIAYGYNGSAYDSHLYGVPPGGGPAVLLNTLHNVQSWGVAVRGNYLYVPDYSAGTIWRYPKSGGSWQAFRTGFIGPMDVAFDKAGNMYVTEWAGGSLARVAAGSRVIVRIASGFDFPFHLQLDGLGRIYLTEIYGNAIWKVWR